MSCSRFLSMAFVLVGSLPLAAATQLTGSATGEWQEFSPRATLVAAEMRADVGDALYDLQLVLIGREQGQVFGEMRPRPLPGDPGPSLLEFVYTVEGSFAELEDGRVHVQSQILLDLNQFGVPGVVVRVGEIDGLLFSAQGSAQGSAGYCPVLPPVLPPDLGLDVAEPIDVQARSSTNTAARSRREVIEPQALPLHPHGEFIARWILH